MDSAVARRIVESGDSCIILDFQDFDASGVVDTTDEDSLELIEFRYQALWARVELEAVFAAGLMSGDA